MPSPDIAPTDFSDETPQEEDERLTAESDIRHADVAVRVEALVDEGFGDSLGATLETLLDWKAENYTDAERRAHIVSSVLIMVATRDQDRAAAAEYAIAGDTP